VHAVGREEAPNVGPHVHTDAFSQLHQKHKTIERTQEITEHRVIQNSIWRIFIELADKVYSQINNCRVNI